MTWLLPVAAGIVVLAAAAWFGITVLREYERGVVFRAGRLRPVYGPGIRFLLPAVDRLERVDLRVVTLTIPPQEVITRDNVPARVNAVVMFRVVDPAKAIMAVEMRSPPPRSRRPPCAPCWAASSWTPCWPPGDLNSDLRTVIEKQTEEWGVRVQVVEIRTSRSRSPCSARWRGRPRPSGNAAPR